MARVRVLVRVWARVRVRYAALTSAVIGGPSVDATAADGAETVLEADAAAAAIERSRGTRATASMTSTERVGTALDIYICTCRAVAKLLPLVTALPDDGSGAHYHDQHHDCGTQPQPQPQQWPQAESQSQRPAALLWRALVHLMVGLLNLSATADSSTATNTTNAHANVSSNVEASANAATTTRASTTKGDSSTSTSTSTSSTTSCTHTHTHLRSR